MIPLYHCRWDVRMLRLAMLAIGLLVLAACTDSDSPEPPHATSPAAAPDNARLAVPPAAGPPPARLGPVFVLRQDSTIALPPGARPRALGPNPGEPAIPMPPAETLLAAPAIPPTATAPTTPPPVPAPKGGALAPETADDFYDDVMITYVFDACGLPLLGATARDDIAQRIQQCPNDEARKAELNAIYQRAIASAERDLEATRAAARKLCADKRAFLSNVMAHADELRFDGSRPPDCRLLSPPS